MKSPIPDTTSSTSKASTAFTASNAFKAFTASNASPSFKVLIITYYWPPGSGAGVQRWLKFSKYLPSVGWEPVILTVDSGYASYPAIDYTLEKDVPAGISVIKTAATDYFRLYSRDKSKVPAAGFASGNGDGLKARIIRFIRGNFFIPDPRRGWNKYAFKKACEIINNEGINHIITTSPPHSTQLIGLKLKKRYPDIKWIADLRDPWTDIYYYKQFYHSPLSLWLDKNYETRVLKNSDKLITVGPALAELFSGKREGINEKISVITNGYDPDDFRSRQGEPPERFTITYVGTISELYPIDGFLDSLNMLQNNNRDFQLRFVGLSPPNIREKVRLKLREGKYEFHEYVNHREAVDYMLNSSLLLLIIPEHPSGKSILTGKLFEYIAASRRILCLGPVDGDAAEIIRSNGFGETFDYNDITGMEKYIINSMDKPASVSKGQDKYSHSSIVNKLVALLK